MSGGHWSDCAVHNEPAYPAGNCDCGALLPEQPKCKATWEDYFNLANDHGIAACDADCDMELAKAYNNLAVAANKVAKILLATKSQTPAETV